MSLYANRFSGKSAIVTGGASGLGLQVATRIAAEGGKVALWDINPDALAEAKKCCAAHYTHALDVSDYQAVVKAVRESSAALGRVDILVASAGITGATVPVSEFPVDSWLRVMDVNLNGLFYCCREVIPFVLSNR
jgi:3-oxoacyl-[acyl-carrier protein] reductase